MIGRIRGILLDKQAPELLVDVQGVGYEVQASLQTFFELPELQQSVCLYTHLVVREDAQQLYGFIREAERRLFRELIRVNGVGPKLALAILSGMSSDELIRSVRADDIAALVRLPGVGKKTAERLLVELRDRLKQISPDPESLAIDAPNAGGKAERAVLEEAESALLGLGYKPAEAARLVAAVDNAGLDSAELIRQALKAAARQVG